MIARKDVERLPLRPTKAMRRRPLFADVECVESPDFVLAKPIPILITYIGGDEPWAASNYEVGLFIDGTSPRHALERMRGLALFAYELWLRGKEQPGPWGHFSPQRLAILEDYFARRTH